MADDLASYLDAWIRHYSDEFGNAYHANDVTILRQYCHVPSMRLTVDGVRWLASYEDIDAHWSAAHAALRPKDYSHSVFHNVDVRVISPGAAFITVDCSRLDRSGGTIMRFLSSYTVASTPDGWRITAWLPHGDRTL